MGTADIVTAQHALLQTALNVSSKGSVGFTTSTGLRLDTIYSGRAIMHVKVNECNRDVTPTSQTMNEALSGEG